MMEPGVGSSFDRALHHDDMHAARELEDEIERRGQCDNYLIALSKECDIYSYERNELPLTAQWELLRATPEQRARAFFGRNGGNMTRRTIFQQGARAAQYQRRQRASRVFRWSFHPNEEAQHYITLRMVGAALSDPTEGMRHLSRVGVSFKLTRWQRLLLKIPYKRTLRMQRYILKNLS